VIIEPHRVVSEGDRGAAASEASVPPTPPKPLRASR